ncbi:MAG: pyridine nucleotide-disulfide oxidoreductase [Pseudonocardiaceae bacterium]|nr:pyridine nucleotide-disulfide oxidoreductase [Pseudonocardiaceae bacterium]
MKIVIIIRVCSFDVGSAAERQLDALVIGAGPAGVGTGLAMMLVDDLVFGVVERGRVGETFRRWPERMRFLTPSFTGNAFGAIDLNAVHPETSPAHTLKVDYPSGAGYAHYLESVGQHFGVPVRERCGVLAVEPSATGYTVVTSEGPVPARTVVWAAGEFGTPSRPPIPGNELGVHSAKPAAWQAPDEAPVVVIGGYESGIDVACALVADGHPVTVLDPSSPWEATGSDPSLTLAPRTRQRLHHAESSGLLELAGKHEATAIEHDGTQYVVDAGRTRFRSPVAPVLATGFRPTMGPVAELFDRRSDGWPLVTGDDESTIAPGVFLAGPAVRHDDLHLCFVYKFRQRFAHLAKVIGDRLGRDTTALEAYRAVGMLVEDVSCCAQDCAC